MRPLPATLSWLVRSLGSTRLFGSRRSFIILMFHRVLATKDPMLPDEPDEREFAARLAVLAQNFKVLPLLEAHERLSAGTLPSRTVCITFDDGYLNNLESALPALQAHDFPATVFVAPGFMDGSAMFNDVVIEAIRVAPVELDLTDLELGRFSLPNAPARASAASRIIAMLKYVAPSLRSRMASKVAERSGLASMPRLMMNATELRGLRDAGVEIGAHTVSHPILSRVDIDDARREIADSKRLLEDILGQPVRSFAYPNGKPGQDYGPEHVHAVQTAGFEVAVSTAWGAIAGETNCYELPRIAPWDTTSARYVARILTSYRNVSPNSVVGT